jgi:oligopeptide transport system ATP-binding protein
MTEPLLRVRALVKNFAVRRGFLARHTDLLRAVDHVSFDLDAGETLGVVGESGCGKSTTGRCILRLIEPDAGEVWFEGKNVIALNQSALRALSRDMQIIFQDPYASLNPRKTVGSIVGEALIIHRLVKSAKEYKDRVIEFSNLWALEPNITADFLTSSRAGNASGLESPGPYRSSRN